MKSISLSIQQLARMVDTIFEHRIEDDEISRGQYFYILYLYENEGANQYDISQNLLIDKTTVAKALKKLESNKIIMRKTDQRDKRKVKVYLTSKGKEAYETVKSVYDDIEEKLDRQFSKEKTDMFKDFVDMYIQELDLNWSRIKKYKKKVTYALAEKTDYEQIQKRIGIKFARNDIAFVNKYGDYVLNWLVFEDVEKEEISIVKSIKLHPSESEQDDDVKLVSKFIEWHDKHNHGELYMLAREDDIEMQELILKLGFVFKAYEKKNEQYWYYYDRFKI